MVVFNTQGLVPAIVQDASTGEVLMMAYMNQESLGKTLETGEAWFWSRRRQELWHKGATSGHYLKVRKVLLDCDSDTILLLSEPTGAGEPPGGEPKPLGVGHLPMLASLDPNQVGALTPSSFMLWQVNHSEKGTEPSVRNR